MTARTDRGRGGSVLMETVIAIPIFLLLIGASLWLGDLGLARHRTLTADRYAAWNEGNRLGGAGTDSATIWKGLFNSEPWQKVEQVQVTVDSQDWYREVRGQVTARVAMPAWTLGLLQAGVTWEGDPIEDKRAITGRDDPHLVVMRGGSRSADNSSINWSEVASAPTWPKSGTPMSKPGAVQAEYERFGKFVGWSK